MAELKFCPFCGNHAVIAEMDEAWYFEWVVYCPKCHATFAPHFATYEEAIEAWNRRADNG